MSNITQAVNLIENKLKILLEKYLFLKEENDLLYSKLSILENQMTKEKQQFNELEKQYNLLKVAKTIEGSEQNSRETKLKINALIREIDQCIVQLSE